MPVPTQPAQPPYASESLANSMSPGIAKAMGLGFLETSDTDAAVLQVSGDNPFPVTVISGGQTDALTNTQLRASPVPVYQYARPILSTSVAEFTSTSSAEILPSGIERSGAIIFVPEESVAMHIRWGTDPVSSADRSYTIQPGGAYQIPSEFANVAVQGIMSAAGNAFITSFNLSDA